MIISEQVGRQHRGFAHYLPLCNHYTPLVWNNYARLTRIPKIAPGAPTAVTLLQVTTFHRQRPLPASFSKEGEVYPMPPIKGAVHSMPPTKEGVGHPMPPTKTPRPHAPPPRHNVEMEPRIIPHRGTTWLDRVFDTRSDSRSISHLESEFKTLDF